MLRSYVKKIYSGKIGAFVILLMIIAIAAYLRLDGAAWGLPTRLHPDEGNIADTAIHLAKTHSFEPIGRYERPGHTSIKLNTLMYLVLNTLQYGINEGNAVYDNIRLYYGASRALSGVFGVFAVLLAYLIGAQMAMQSDGHGTVVNNKQRACGLAAAGLTALYPSFVEHSHYITPEVYQTAFMLAVSYIGLLYLRKPTVLKLFSMSAMSALAFCEKYPGLWCLISVFAVVIMTNPKRKRYGEFARSGKRNIGNIIKHCALAVVFFGICVFIISPVLLTDILNVLARIKVEARSTHLGADGLGTWGNFAFYFSNFIYNGGIILFASAILGMGVLFKRNIKAFVVMSIGVAYILFMSCFALHWERWGVPFYAYMVIFAGYGVFSVAEWAIRLLKKTKVKKRVYLLNSMLSSLFLLLLVNLISGSIACTLSFAASTDTRVASVAFCSEIGAVKENTVYEGYTPFKTESPSTLNFDIDSFAVINPSIKYVIISSTMYDRYYAEPKRYAKQVAFYEKLKTDFEEVCRYEPYSDSGGSPLEVVNISNNLHIIGEILKGGNSGPTLVFYKVKEGDIGAGEDLDGLTFFIEYANFGMYLDMKGTGTEDGGNLQLWDYTGADNQKFKFVKIGGSDNLYHIYAVHSGKVLGVGDNKGNNVNVCQWSVTDGTAWQQWQAYSTNGESFLFINAYSGKALHVHDDEIDIGTLVKQFDWDKDTGQSFKLIPAE